MNFQRLVNTLETWQTGNETSMAEVLHRLATTFKRRSLLIIVSDFFDELEPLAQSLKQFRHLGHEVVLVQVVAPEEEDFPFSKPTLFRSLELDTHRILVDPHRLRSLYLQQYQEFLKELSQMCGNVGIDYIKLLTNEPYHKALGAYLDRRNRDGR